MAHTHSDYNPSFGIGNNIFSNTDKKTSDAKKIDGYVATPDGSLQKYGHSTKFITTIDTTIPSDPNDPTRKNTVNPANLPKNEPTYGAWD